MAIDKDSNGYTFMFAIIMVVIVGVALASISIGLKPLQVKNDQDKKMLDILGAIKVEATRDNAADLFSQHIKEQFVLDAGGNKIDGKAFDIDVKKQNRDKTLADADKKYPLYVCDVSGATYYVVPMVGSGLWGPIWGFVAVKEDKTTIFGAKFDHKGETPGLGAEIKSYAKFQEQFESGKKIDQNLTVSKSGADQSSPYEVDGITGGTITSVGVQEMFNRTMKIYNQAFQNL